MIKPGSNYLAGGGVTPDTCLEFLEAFFALVKRHAKKTTRLAFINADWRDFQNTRASEETGKGGILIDDYLDILKRTGWQRTHIIQAPMSSQRFSAVVVCAMQKKRTFFCSGNAAPLHRDPFKAAVAFYPYCMNRLDNSNAPLLILIGEKDDWTPANACSGMIPSGKTVHEIKLKIYKNTHHCFDCTDRNKVYMGHTAYLGL